MKKNTIIWIINIILIISITSFLYWLINRKTKASNGILTKGKVIKMVNLPKNGLSIHLLYSINNNNYKGFPNVSSSLKNKININDSIYIKYDITDYSNTTVVIDSL